MNDRFKRKFTIWVHSSVITFTNTRPLERPNGQRRASEGKQRRKKGGGGRGDGGGMVVSTGRGAKLGREVIMKLEL